MGWPLAVANGLSARRDAAVFATLAPLGAGHLLAMALAVLPFALLGELVRHGPSIRLGAGLVLLLFGVYRLAVRRHPRVLARIPSTRLAWWSFVMALAHGAGLMLVPIVLGLCATARDAASGPPALETLMQSTLVTAIAATLVHTAAMLASGGALPGWSLSLPRAAVPQARLVRPRPGVGREPGRGRRGVQCPGGRSVRALSSRLCPPR